MPKAIYISIFTVFISLSTFADVTDKQIYQAKKALRDFVLPSQMQKMSTKQLNSYFKEVSYRYLQPRDILLMTKDLKTFVRHKSDMIYSRTEGFRATQAIPLKEGEFLRIIQKYQSNDSDFNPNKTYSGVSGEYIDVLNFTVIKLDKNFEPIGDIFYLTIRGKTDRKAQEFKSFEGGFLTRNNSLSFRYAKANDIVMNAQSVKLNGIVLPAFSIGLITKIESKKIQWTIANYRHTLTLHLLNCPEELKAHNCEVKITGSRSYADPIWAHYIAPENRRQIKIWKATLFY